MWWIILIFVIVLVIACFTAWHYAEHHELHKVRAEFEKHLKYFSSKDKFVDGLEYAEKIIDLMDEDFYGDYHNPDDDYV